MTRETRANLIFLLILLAILAPGGVILFRKKLAPTIKPMAMPEAVSNEVVYLSPMETPPGKKRVEPPHTAKWVESLVRERIKADGEELLRPTDRDGLPLVSAKKTFQVVALAGVGSPDTKLFIIDWTPEASPSTEWTADWKDNLSAGHIAQSAQIEVPDLVRQELGDTGLVRPPHQIAWIELEIPLPARDPVSLGHARREGRDFVNFVPSFTNSATTGN